MKRSTPGESGATASCPGRSSGAGQSESEPWDDAPSAARRRLGCARPEAQICATGGGAARSMQLLDLGDGALRSCFAHLPLDERARLATTCRRLRAVAEHSLLWTELRFRGSRAPVCEATLCALITRARAAAGAAFTCLDLDGATLADDLTSVSLPQLRQLQPLLAGASGVGAQLTELRLGECAALPPAAATALASAELFPALRDSAVSFRLAFDDAGIARLALPRGCCVSLESGRRLGRSREDAAVDDKFATALSAVAAAGGTVHRVSTCGHGHGHFTHAEYHATGLAALVARAPAALAPLTSLDLRTCVMPRPEERNALAAALAGCTQLARVTLARRDLYPAELRVVAALPSLTSLDISSALLGGWSGLPSDNVTAAAAALRAGLVEAAARGGAARLLSLDASGCVLRDAGARELAAALADGARLRELRLGSNGITCAGAIALALGIEDAARADASRGAVHPLRTLSLAQNAVRQAGAAALTRTLSCPGVELLVLDLERNDLAAPRR